MSRRFLLRLLAAAPATDHVSDAELLRRFVVSNDPAAFELIVRRHADAVWAACRRLLRSDTDAEDAFQATFLALIRKACDVRTPCAGGWLYRVAVNAALKLRERNARTPTTEPNQLDATPVPHTEPPDAEALAAVHEELARLSERERLPVVLCDLEGLSHADAAKALGWPVGTVSGRLSRARAKLRERLERRGMAPSGVLIPAAVAPPHLIPNARSLTAGAPPAIVSLTEGALAMTTKTTWKWVASVVMCVGLIGTGAAIGLTQPAPSPAPRLPGTPPPAPEPAPEPAPSPAKEKAAGDEWVADPKSNAARRDKAIKSPPSAFPRLVPPEPDPNDKNPEQRWERFGKLCPRLLGGAAVAVTPADDLLRKVLKARLHQGTLELREILEVTRITGDLPQPPAMYELLTDIRIAAIELWAKEPKELVPWLEELVVMAKEFERVQYHRIVTGVVTPRMLNAAARHRLTVEAELLKAKGRP
ncbi:MAG: sigma-70 family RNA polymerase sigma factor [Planctomycetes bacterium]|nr:sigma-70 family RNA polymerase sigma factor [Planctomycetota bacterium]